jgi:uncharacterized membrane protein YoaK (UPF0700 family)
MSTPPPSGSASPGKRPSQAFGNDLVGAALLSGVAGYVDTAGFLALYGLLTAHVTGDLVTATSVVVENAKTGAATRLAMIPIFMLAVAATALFARRCRRRGAEPLAALLALMTLALAVFGTTGVALHPWALTADGWAVAFIGATGVVAMAVQNTLMRDALSTFCATTFMTGNLTQVTIDLVDILLPAPHTNPRTSAEHRTQAKLRLRRFGFPLLGFTIGGAFGAVLTHALGLWSIALPTFVMGALTIVASRRRRRDASSFLETAGKEASSATRRGHDAGAVDEAALEPVAKRGPSSASGRHASGTRLSAMQVADDERPLGPKVSGTYATATTVTPSEAPTSNRTPQDRRRARS